MSAVGGGIGGEVIELDAAAVGDAASAGGQHDGLAVDTEGDGLTLRVMATASWWWCTSWRRWRASVDGNGSSQLPALMTVVGWRAVSQDRRRMTCDRRHETAWLSPATAMTRRLAAVVAGCDQRCRRRSSGWMSAAHQAPRSSCADIIDQGNGARVPGPERRQSQRHHRQPAHQVGAHRQPPAAWTKTTCRAFRTLTSCWTNLKDESRRAQADGCAIVALFAMSAAMLHPSIAAGRWLSGISDPSQLKNEENVVNILSHEWERIMRHDFHPVPEPALEAVHAVQTAGKPDGLALMRHVVCAAAEPIAHACADLGRRPCRPAVQQG